MHLLGLTTVLAAWALLQSVSPPEDNVSPILSSFEQVARITYEPDQDDYWQSPRETLLRGEGDCEDKALLLQHILRLQGWDPDIVFGVQDWETSERMHAWVELELEGECYVLDPTQGFIARRSHLVPGHHTPVVGMPRVLRNLREYECRTGVRRVSVQYDCLLALMDDADPID